MSKTLVAVLALVVGLVLGGVGGMAMIGASTGIGVATGLSAGICGIVKAAQDEELLTDEEVDRVFNRAASNLSTLTGTEDEGTTIVGGASECDAVLAKLREAASG